MVALYTLRQTYINHKIVLMTASDQITQYIQGFTDWRGDILAELRATINAASPDVNEDWKWMVPVWTSNGLVCAISAFKDHVKLNFFKGAALPDPDKLINNGLSSKDHRSIDFSEGNKVNKTAITAMVKAAVKLNDK